MWSYGVGAMIDLPRLSVMVEGLDWWDPTHARRIAEDRLLMAVRRELGPQVERLLEPPLPDQDPWKADELDPIYRIGVPVTVFPNWLRCPRCELLSDAHSGVFTFEGKSTWPDSCRFVHKTCPKKGRPPACVPARFLVACKAGHVDDFPWREFVHRGPTTCKGTLRFFEIGSSLETANLFVACDKGLGFGDDGGEEPIHPGTESGCRMRPRSLVDGFGKKAETALPRCRGRHPHLRGAPEGCGRELRTILLGSSSSWFPKSISVLSIPTGSTELERAIEDGWSVFGDVRSVGVIDFLRSQNRLGEAFKYSDDEIWAAIESRRELSAEDSDEQDIKGPEWAVLSDPEAAPSSVDFVVSKTEAPSGFEQSLLPTILVEKIREVNALIGFTRLEAPEDLLHGEEDLTYAPLSRQKPEWTPATEVRGEGLLVRFDLERVSAWEKRPEIQTHLEALEEANRVWRIARKLDPDRGYPGHRHVLLHSFSHLLMRELALECGYSAASIRERIYASEPGDEPEMAGVLIYTAAPDSEGTLGGLVRLGEPETLGRIIGQALDHAELCASDPLCAEHEPVPDRTLHAAACHACSFAPETACEFGNRFLDRATVVPTFRVSNVAFFA